MPLTIVARTECPQKRAETDTREAYCRMLDGRASRYLQGDKGILPALAFAGVRCFNGLPLDSMDWQDALFVESTIGGLLAALTPRQILQTFPPEKSYDGARYQCKDYFTTMESVRAYPLDKPIGEEKLFDFLWDYMNPDTGEFMIRKLQVLDMFRRSQGQPGMMEAFMAERGITPKYRRTGPDGKEYLFNPEDGSVTRVYPKRPFKVISSKKK